jgi:two-component system cell cycle response regulator
MSAPKKPSRGGNSEPARRATDSRPVRKLRSNAITDVFARHTDSTRVKKGDDQAAPASKPTAIVEETTAKTTAEDAVPRKATSLESAPIGLRKASISDSGGAKTPMRGADFGDVARPMRDSGPVGPSGPSSKSGRIAQGTRENEAVTGKHKRKSEAVVVASKHVYKTAPITVKLQARWRRALRRAGKVSLGAMAGALACVVVSIGGVDGAALFASEMPLAQSVIASSIAALVVIAVIRRVQFSPPSARAQRVSMWLAAATDLADLELCLTLVAGTHLVIAVTGGLDSLAYPVLYGLVAFAMTVLARPGAFATLGAALFLEGALLVRTGITEETIFAASLHALFLVGAALAHALLLRGLTSRYRHRRARRLDEELVALRDSARDYRLIAAALGPGSRAPRTRDEEERLLAIGGVGMIDDSMSWVLTTLKRSLNARTVALLWVDDSDGATPEARIKLVEVASDADDIVENPRLPTAGVLGAVIRDRQPLLVAATKPGQLPYYDNGRAGIALVAVPIMEGVHLRGILAADRDAPFSEADRDLLNDAGGQVLRVVQAEQVFRAVERAKYEHERFYQATAMLGRALTPEQVMATAFDACAAIVDYDAAAIALYDKDRAKHRIAAVRIGDGGKGIIDENITGFEFKDNAGLASMVIKNRHYLPAGGEPREVSAPIYTRRIKIDDAKSLLVLPLLSADEAIGTFTLVARAEKRFGKDVREMLAVIANQVAVSLQNGYLYKQMETMATTDGLTGLTNHRTFQSRFEDLLQRAARHNHKVALLLCDVDHFKKVNDNYGHPIGDEVLRRVAKVLQEVPRKIDIPARYGGEEFAVLLDGVDVSQAKTVAERIRVEISKIVVETDKGPLSVTESIGVAAFPDDGRDRAILIERADLALYHAKHSGRNRVVTWSEAQAAKAKQAG